MLYEGYHKLAHFLFDHVFEHAFNFKKAHLFFPFQIRFLYGHVIFLQIIFQKSRDHMKTEFEKGKINELI